MESVPPHSPLQPGVSAPDFTLPVVHREGTVSLADYRGKSPLLLALFRGLYCPLCRRNIVQLGQMQETLQAAGVETLGVVATKPEHARLYFRFRPPRIPIAADPDMTTLRAYGVPKPPVTPELFETYESTRIDPSGELPEPVPITEVCVTLNELDGYDITETDLEDLGQQWTWDTSTQLIGQFLIDQDGIVRWVNIECAKQGAAGLGTIASEEEILAAVQALST